MKRRDFIVKGTIGLAGAGFAGCAARGAGNFNVSKSKLQWTDYKIDPTIPKPKGTMPTGVIGKTGIKVSKFGFGSHIRKDVGAAIYKKDRERIILEAHDLGITMFDVYDKEQECFQYEPMGEFLQPFRKDITISIAPLPYDGRTFEQQFERDLRAFRTDYIDMARLHAYDEKSPDWKNWETLFKFKEKGYLRAVGMPVHDISQVDLVLKNYPLDYIIFPYNFYHNLCWHGDSFDNFDPLPELLRKKGVGVVTMKAFAGDFLVNPFKDIAHSKEKFKDLDYNKAAMRYVINSKVNPDATITGMYNMDHLYGNVGAFFSPKMSKDERDMLIHVRKNAKLVADSYLPSHYKFLEKWVGKDEDLHKQA